MFSSFPLTVFILFNVLSLILLVITCIQGWNLFLKGFALSYFLFMFCMSSAISANFLEKTELVSFLFKLASLPAFLGCLFAILSIRSDWKIRPGLVV